MEGSVDLVPWLDITNVICNTIQVLGLAYIAQLVSSDIHRRRSERHSDVQRRNRIDEAEGRHAD